MCRATPANGPGESQNAGAVTCRRETPWEEGGGPGFVPLSQGAEKAAGKTGERPETARAWFSVVEREAEPEGGATAEGTPRACRTHLPTRGDTAWDI